MGRGGSALRIRTDLHNNGYIIDGIAEPYVGIQVYKRDFDWKMSEHSHAYHQLIFVISGSMRAICGQEVWNVGPGQVHVQPPCMAHALASDGYFQLGVDIHADSAVRGLASLLSDYVQQPTVIDCPEVLPDIEELIDKCALGNRISVARVISLLDTVVIKCLEAHTRTGTERFDAKLSHYVNLHLAEKFTLEEVAGAFHMSVPHLERLARKHFNSSVIELRNQRRLTLSKTLLISTQLSIAEIAERVGYPDPAHFSSFFKKRMRMAPSRYRQTGGM